MNTILLKALFFWLPMSGSGDTIIVVNYHFHSLVEQSPAKMELRGADSVFITRKKSIVTKTSIWELLSAKHYCRIVDRHGRIIEEGIWIGEVFIGPYREYYRNGKLKREGTYSNSLEDGEWKYYSKKGKLKSIKQFDDGVLKSMKKY